MEKKTEKELLERLKSKKNRSSIILVWEGSHLISIVKGEELGSRPLVMAKLAEAIEILAMEIEAGIQDKTKQI